jgi:hypothetical protein
MLTGVEKVGSAGTSGRCGHASAAMGRRTAKMRVRDSGIEAGRDGSRRLSNRASSCDFRVSFALSPFEAGKVSLQSFSLSSMCLSSLLHGLSGTANPGWRIASSLRCRHSWRRTDISVRDTPVHLGSKTSQKF